MDERMKDEMQTFAGHLLAEMYTADDQYRTGKLTKDQYLSRLRVIRNRARSGNRGFAKAMEQIQMTFTATMAQAEELRA